MRDQHFGENGGAMGIELTGKALPTL